MDELGVERAGADWTVQHIVPNNFCKELKFLIISIMLCESFQDLLPQQIKLLG
jgi:hypothetical protein